jgi:hypothetical protein
MSANPLAKLLSGSKLEKMNAFWKAFDSIVDGLSLFELVVQPNNNI